MTGKAHTPGAWRLGTMHKDGSYAIHAAKASIVHCKPFSSSAREAEANARLIAAAPAMLEALRFVETDPCFKLLGSVTHDVVRAALSQAGKEEA